MSILILKKSSGKSPNKGGLHLDLAYSLFFGDSSLLVVGVSSNLSWVGDTWATGFGAGGVRKKSSSKGSKVGAGVNKSSSKLPAVPPAACACSMLTEFDREAESVPSGWSINRFRWEGCVAVGGSRGGLELEVVLELMAGVGIYDGSTCGLGSGGWGVAVAPSTSVLA